jgi:hypothetical protein
MPVLGLKFGKASLVYLFISLDSPKNARGQVCRGSPLAEKDRSKETSSNVFPRDHGLLSKVTGAALGGP